jgi:hypothetical protein
MPQPTTWSEEVRDKVHCTAGLGGAVRGSGQPHGPPKTHAYSMQVNNKLSRLCEGFEQEGLNRDYAGALDYTGRGQRPRS